ncbi:unnamed protein product [Pseudo-nitzschia multistriata]|uniref:Uncharacterized protein n=1 Tax=Pseudo-nitzschia multistriata TaxID=183589 RepID=A0A448ZL12_9STRA|nr:unnamed protein product [Pseudo-nitzschia multistriata]
MEEEEAPVIPRRRSKALKKKSSKKASGEMTDSGRSERKLLKQQSKRISSKKLAKETFLDDRSTEEPPKKSKKKKKNTGDDNEDEQDAEQRPSLKKSKKKKSSRSSLAGGESSRNLKSKKKTGSSSRNLLGGEPSPDAPKKSKKKTRSSKYTALLEDVEEDDEGSGGGYEPTAPPGTLQQQQQQQGSPPEEDAPRSAMELVESALVGCVVAEKPVDREAEEHEREQQRRIQEEAASRAAAGGRTSFDPDASMGSFVPASSPGKGSARSSLSGSSSMRFDPSASSDSMRFGPGDHDNDNSVSSFVGNNVSRSEGGSERDVSTTFRRKPKLPGGKKKARESAKSLMGSLRGGQGVPFWQSSRTLSRPTFSSDEDEAFVVDGDGDYGSGHRRESGFSGDRRSLLARGSLPPPPAPGPPLVEGAAPPLEEDERERAADPSYPFPAFGVTLKKSTRDLTRGPPSPPGPFGVRLKKSDRHLVKEEEPPSGPFGVTLKRSKRHLTDEEETSHTTELETTTRPSFGGVVLKSSKRDLTKEEKSSPTPEPEATATPSFGGVVLKNSKRDLTEEEEETSPTPELETTTRPSFGDIVLKNSKRDLTKEEDETSPTPEPEEEDETSPTPEPEATARPSFGGVVLKNSKRNLTEEEDETSPTPEPETVARPAFGIVLKNSKRDLTKEEDETSPTPEPETTARPSFGGVVLKNSKRDLTKEDETSPTSEPETVARPAFGIVLKKSNRDLTKLDESPPEAEFESAQKETVDDGEDLPEAPTTPEAETTARPSFGVVLKKSNRDLTKEESPPKPQSEVAQKADEAATVEVKHTARKQEEPVWAQKRRESLKSQSQPEQSAAVDKEEGSVRSRKKEPEWVQKRRNSLESQSQPEQSAAFDKDEGSVRSRKQEPEWVQKRRESLASQSQPDRAEEVDEEGSMRSRNQEPEWLHKRKETQKSDASMQEGDSLSNNKTIDGNIPSKSPWSVIKKNLKSVKALDATNPLTGPSQSDKGENDPLGSEMRKKESPQPEAVDSSAKKKNSEEEIPSKSPWLAVKKSLKSLKDLDAIHPITEPPEPPATQVASRSKGSQTGVADSLLTKKNVEEDVPSKSPWLAVKKSLKSTKELDAIFPLTEPPFSSAAQDELVVSKSMKPNESLGGTGEVDSLLGEKDIAKEISPKSPWLTVKKSLKSVRELTAIHSLTEPPDLLTEKNDRVVNEPMKRKEFSDDSGEADSLSVKKNIEEDTPSKSPWSAVKKSLKSLKELDAIQPLKEPPEKKVTKQKQPFGAEVEGSLLATNDIEEDIPPKSPWLVIKKSLKSVKTMDAQHPITEPRLLDSKNGDDFVAKKAMKEEQPSGAEAADSLSPKTNIAEDIPPTPKPSPWLAIKKSLKSSKSLDGRQSKMALPMSVIENGAASQPTKPKEPPGLRPLHSSRPGKSLWAQKKKDMTGASLKDNQSYQSMRIVDATSSRTGAHEEGTDAMHESAPVLSTEMSDSPQEDGSIANLSTTSSRSGLASSLYSSTSASLRSVGAPLENKWKASKPIDDDTETMQDAGNNAMYTSVKLKKVKPVVEEGVEDDTSMAEDNSLLNISSRPSLASSLYSAASASLRSVGTPVENKWKASKSELDEDDEMQDSRKNLMYTSVRLKKVKAAAPIIEEEEDDGDDNIESSEENSPSTEASTGSTKHNIITEISDEKSPQDKVQRNEVEPSVGDDTKADTLEILNEKPPHPEVQVDEVEASSEDDVKNVDAEATENNSAHTEVQLDEIKPSIEDDAHNDNSQAPGVNLLYTAVKLKKVKPTPTTLDEELTKNRPSLASSLYSSASASLRSVGAPPENKWKASKSNEDEDDPTQDPSKNSMYTSVRLKKVQPVAPVIEEDAQYDPSETSEEHSLYTSVQLKKVGSTPDDEESPTSRPSLASSLYSSASASLRNIGTPVEHKWKESKTIGLIEEDDVGKLYSSQHQLLRSVAPPVEEKSIATDNEDAELHVSELQVTNRKILMLISTVSGSQEQKTAQDRALTILKGMHISPEQLEQVDGADPANLERRNELFAVSGIRAKYPQFFVVNANDKIEYLADWESFEMMNEVGSLSESMNLDVSLSDASPLGKEDDIADDLNSENIDREGDVENYGRNVDSENEAEVKDVEDGESALDKDDTGTSSVSTGIKEETNLTQDFEGGDDEVKNEVQSVIAPTSECQDEGEKPENSVSETKAFEEDGSVRDSDSEKEIEKGVVENLAPDSEDEDEIENVQSVASVNSQIEKDNLRTAEYPITETEVSSDSAEERIEAENNESESGKIIKSSDDNIENEDSNVGNVEADGEETADQESHVSETNNKPQVEENHLEEESTAPDVVAEYNSGRSEDSSEEALPPRDTEATNVIDETQEEEESSALANPKDIDIVIDGDEDPAGSTGVSVEPTEPDEDDELSPAKYLQDGNEETDPVEEVSPHPVVDAQGEEKQSTDMKPERKNSEIVFGDTSDDPISPVDTDNNDIGTNVEEQDSKGGDQAEEDNGAEHDDSVADNPHVESINEATEEILSTEQNAEDENIADPPSESSPGPKEVETYHIETLEVESEQRSYESTAGDTKDAIDVPEEEDDTEIVAIQEQEDTKDNETFIDENLKQNRADTSEATTSNRNDDDHEKDGKGDDNSASKDQILSENEGSTPVEDEVEADNIEETEDFGSPSNKESEVDTHGDGMEPQAKTEDEDRATEDVGFRDSFVQETGVLSEFLGEETPSKGDEKCDGEEEEEKDEEQKEEEEQNKEQKDQDQKQNEEEQKDEEQKDQDQDEKLKDEEQKGEDQEQKEQEREEDDKFTSDLELQKASFASKNSNHQPTMMRYSDDSEEEASDGGWSDDDSATIKSEYTELSYATFGSAVVFDGRAMTSKDEGTKKLSELVTAAAQEHQNPTPPKPKAKPVAQPLTTTASKKNNNQDILFTPMASDNKAGDDKSAANEKEKDKKKKKSKKEAKEPPPSLPEGNDDIAIDVDDPPAMKKEKKKDKARNSIQEDIVLDFGEQDTKNETPSQESVGNSEADETQSQSKKKKKKKSKEEKENKKNKRKSAAESSKQVQEPGPSESELREKMIKDTVKQLIEDSNKYELRPEKPFDDDSAECLLKAALKICHLKKFYDTTKDKIVYFPSPVHACFDYRLMEAAEEFYEEEYPSDLCRALRNVAFGMIEKEADDDYDEEYMALVATDVEI